MTRDTLRESIQHALTAFTQSKFEENALQLFETLGYRSERRIEGLDLTADNISQSFSSPYLLKEKEGLTQDWLSVSLLFQLTDDEIHANSQLRMAFDTQKKVDPTIYRSYLFMGIELKGSNYTRTQLADATREINSTLR